MLALLLKTRARHAFNYLRAKFDKATIIYIALISLILLYLVGRSPADIGYSIQMLTQGDFPQKWLTFVLRVLPIFYIFSESMAYLTLRPTAGLSMLGSLPIKKNTICNYFLLRYYLKTTGKLLLLLLPLWFGASPVLERLLIFTTTTSLLFAIQLGAYIQAHNLRQYANQNTRALKRWLMIELAAIAILYFVPQKLNVDKMYDNFWGQAILLLLAVAATVLFYRLVLRYYLPEFMETEKSPLMQKRQPAILQKTDFQPRSITLFMNLQDLFFLQKKKKSFFVLQALGVFLGVMVTAYNSNAWNAFGGVIFIQSVLSFFLINALMELFRRDANVFPLLRALPLPVSKFWLARWIFASLMLALPFLIPNLIILIQFHLEASHFGFIAFSLIVIPTLFALIYCNAGFGTFPHVNFGANMMNISLVLIFLFWFYVPFGSFMMLGIALLWVRKSLLNIKFLELE